MNRTVGPGARPPSGRAIVPARRSCTYVRNRGFSASLAILGRRAWRSAFHCATEARYSSLPPRVATLRRSSREIVDAGRLSLRPISRTPRSWILSKAISSRSANDR